MVGEDDFLLQSSDSEGSESNCDLSPQSMEETDDSAGGSEEEDEMPASEPAVHPAPRRILGRKSENVDALVREGVQFMFDCVSGSLSDANINGCILADDIGLGKTLQSIAPLFSLLGQGFDNEPVVRKAIIVTPTSLVSNWESEIKKWNGERVKLVALCEGTREDALHGIDSFTSSRSSLQVLIVSYETFRNDAAKFGQNGSCDLLICDEAHRLKNDQTLTNRALASLCCKLHILLSVTPMQNDFDEFYAMVNFTNPGVLGDASFFRRYYEVPIVFGREPTAPEEQKKLGSERSVELSRKINQDKCTAIQPFTTKDD